VEELVFCLLFDKEQVNHKVVAVYSKTVMKHFMKPKNMKEIKNPDGVGKAGNPSCGDVMYLYIKVKDAKVRRNIGSANSQNSKSSAKIIDASFKTLGCAMAIAASDALCDMVKGKTIKQAEKITSRQVAAYLKDVPKIKYHCSILGVETLKKAIEDYKTRT
jgi:nitrogen fixation NifU-like protein